MPCFPGTYGNFSRCEPCPTGTYQTMTGQLNCDVCSTGKHVTEDKTQCQGKLTSVYIIILRLCYIILLAFLRYLRLSDVTFQCVFQILPVFLPFFHELFLAPILPVYRRARCVHPRVRTGTFKITGDPARRTTVVE